MNEKFGKLDILDPKDIEEMEKALQEKFNKEHDEYVPKEKSA